MEKLFLLKPNFKDANVDGAEQLFYCPHCAMIEGVLSYYTQLQDKLEVIYIDFPRPRHKLVELVGEENQGCPNLVISKDDSVGLDTSYFLSLKGYLFVNKKELIVRYFTDKYGIGKPHP